MTSSSSSSHQDANRFIPAAHMKSSFEIMFSSNIGSFIPAFLHLLSFEDLCILPQLSKTILSSIRRIPQKRIDILYCDVFYGSSGIDAHVPEYILHKTPIKTQDAFDLLIQTQVKGMMEQNMNQIDINLKFNSFIHFLIRELETRAKFLILKNDPLIVFPNQLAILNTLKQCGNFSVSQNKLLPSIEQINDILSQSVVTKELVYQALCVASHTEHLFRVALKPYTSYLHRPFSNHATPYSLFPSNFGRYMTLVGVWRDHHIVLNTKKYKLRTFGGKNRSKNWKCAVNPLPQNNTNGIHSHSEGNCMIHPITKYPICESCLEGRIVKNSQSDLLHQNPTPPHLLLRFSSAKEWYNVSELDMIEGQFAVGHLNADYIRYFYAHEVEQMCTQLYFNGDQASFSDFKRRVHSAQSESDVQSIHQQIFNRKRKRTHDNE
jgi:hypothetical protein